jgi:manganese transport protein
MTALHTSFRRRILSILLWSVLSAAFIGPGTIITASRAGASFGFSLLWALLFSTIACLVLQEAGARIPLATGKNLGQTIAVRYGRNSRGGWMGLLSVVAIVLGAAAYEMGNILGAIAGLEHLLSINRIILVLMIGVVAAVILSIPSLQIIARLLGLVVVAMGVSFLGTAIMLRPPIGELLSGALVPGLPGEPLAALLVLGLIGTTVVPYNLFLGSGVYPHGQSLFDMRLGLGIAIILGGIVSMAVLVTGTAISGSFSIENLADALSEKMGSWAMYLFFFGLFCAGFTSAVTAPLAAAVTVKSIYGIPKRKRIAEAAHLSQESQVSRMSQESKALIDDGDKKPEQKNYDLKYTLVWAGVLATGVLFGLLNIRPIPAIIVAQALNGLILPLISIFLWKITSNKRIMGAQHVNSLFVNLLMGFVVTIASMIGLANIIGATSRVFGFEQPAGAVYLLLLAATAGMIAVIAFFGSKKIYG